MLPDVFAEIVLAHAIVPQIREIEEDPKKINRLNQTYHLLRGWLSQPQRHALRRRTCTDALSNQHQ